MTDVMLEVNDLHVQFPTEDGLLPAVDGVSYTVERGKTLAVVGESGSGKSVTANAVMGLLNRRSAGITGEVLLDGENLLEASTSRVRELRGKKMAMIFQDPLSSLHPYWTIGRQLVEAVRVHQSVSKSAARAQVVEMLDRVGIPNASGRFDEYPHQLSGGMRQRVMIAMALLNGPEMLIADEPTTALDVTVQAQIMQLLRDLQSEFNTAIILITHDLGVVAEMADEVAVMYAGRVVERADVHTLFANPQMPYTWGLLGSVPRMDAKAERLTPIEGNPPSLLRLPTGCVFRPRCDFHTYVEGNRCSTERPELLAATPGHTVRCFIDPDVRSRLAEEQAEIRGAAPLPGAVASAEKESR